MTLSCNVLPCVSEKNYTLTFRANSELRGSLPIRFRILVGMDRPSLRFLRFFVKIKKSVPAAISQKLKAISQVLNCHALEMWCLSKLELRVWHFENCHSLGTLSLCVSLSNIEHSECLPTPSLEWINFQLASSPSATPKKTNISKNEKFENVSFWEMVLPMEIRVTIAGTYFQRMTI